jgi:large subunit ribosomal protein L6
MSKIGKKIIEIPSNINVTIEKGGAFNNVIVKVKGPLGELSQDIRKGINIVLENNIITVTRENDEAINRSYHGLYRSLISNMVIGAGTIFEKKLEIQGVGYRGAQKGNDIELSLGFSHKVMYKPSEGVTVKMIDDTNILISGISKQMVGQTAAEIRQLRLPEPYKGKGIRYLGEQVKRKAGKTAASK